MLDVYVAWIPGLDESSDVLKKLKESNLIHGVEMSSLRASREKIQSSGLKVSLHNPRIGHEFIPNLSNLKCVAKFDSPEGQKLLSEIRMMDNPYVGYHCGFAADDVFKMNGYPDIPKPGSELFNRDVLLERMCSTLTSIHKLINNGLDEDQHKDLLLESLDYSRALPVPWDIQVEDVLLHKKSIETMIKKHGVNAAYNHVTDPDFIYELIEMLANVISPAPGFLLDVAHTYITADTMVHEGLFKNKEAFIDKVIKKLGPLTKQVHINVPVGNDEMGYSDGHMMLDPENKLSHDIEKILKNVFSKCKNLELVTLEMGNRQSNLKTYADEMIEQARILLSIFEKIEERR